MSTRPVARTRRRGDILVLVLAILALMAELISDTAKPFGARAVLDPREEEMLLASRPVTDETGIAGRRERRLLPWDIRTCLDLANADRRLIRELLTATGEALWWELRGESVLPLLPDRPLHKVLSRGGSFGEPAESPIIPYAWLVRNLERLIEELHYHELLARHATLWVGYRDGRARDAGVGLETPTDRFDLLLDALRVCLRRAWIPRVAASRMHLLADRLVPRTPVQRGLFDPPGDRQEIIARLKREVNRRHGRFVLRSGATLPLYAIYQDRANQFDICDVRGKMCFGRCRQSWSR